MPGDGKGSSWRHCRTRGFVYFQYGNALSIVFILILRYSENVILYWLMGYQKFNLIAYRKSRLCGGSHKIHDVDIKTVLGGNILVMLMSVICNQNYDVT